MASKNTLFFVDIESNTVYRLHTQKSKALTKKFPKWNEYPADPETIMEVHNYFKQHGEVIANTESQNVFVGFTN